MWGGVEMARRMPTFFLINSKWFKSMTMKNEKTRFLLITHYRLFSLIFASFATCSLSLNGYKDDICVKKKMEV